MKRPCEMTKEELRLHRNWLLRRWRKTNLEKARATTRKWRKENPEKKRACDRAWRKSNPDITEARKAWLSANNDRLKAYRKKYNKDRYWLNKERDAERKKEYYRNNKEKITATTGKYREKNKDKRRESGKRYYAQNKQKILARLYAYAKNNRALKNEAARKKAKECTHFRVARRLRSRVRQALREQGAINKDKIEKLLGCSISSFRIYIESKLEPGMTLDNIHLDHIVPCALFDLSKPEHQRICFHFSNYQPLFIRDNLTKGARLFHEPGMLRL